MVPDMVDISAGHSPTAIPTVAGVLVSKGTHHAPHPATAAACATLWPMDTLITTSTMTHPTGIVAPLPTLTTSPADITHATIPWTGAALIPATLTALHTKHSQENPTHIQDLQHP